MSHAPYNMTAERLYPTPYAASPWLYVLLLSMATQRHAPRTTTRIRDEYDYVIVGGGSAGSVLASRLSELPCASVLLLEAGKSPPKSTDIPVAATYFIGSDLDWGYRTAPQENTGAALANRSLYLPSGKTIGGSSIFHGMQYVRGNSKIFDGWSDEHGATDWSYDRVLPYFKKLEDNLDPEYLANGYHNRGGPLTVMKPKYGSEFRSAVFRAATSLGYRIGDVNGPQQDGFFDLQATQRWGQRCSNAKAYLLPADNRPNLDIVAGAFVKKVVIDEGAARAVEVDVGGGTRTVRARREVVVSAGAVRSPHLLLLSGIGPAAHLREHEIPVVADLPVGSNLQEHYGILTSYKLRDDFTPFYSKLTDIENIRQYLRFKSGPLTSVSGVATFGLLRSGNETAEVPDYMLLFAEGIGNRTKTNGDGKALQPWFYCLAMVLQPKSRGRVSLRSADPRDPPLVDPAYFDDPRDLNVLVEGLKKCGEFVSSGPLRDIGAGRLDDDYPHCPARDVDEDGHWRCVARQNILSASHLVGTVRMGDPADPATVLDQQLRVKGISNLRVVDASVMPAITNGNTNTPTTMIAERAADLIKRGISCS